MGEGDWSGRHDVKKGCLENEGQEEGEETGAPDSARFVTSNFQNTKSSEVTRTEDLVIISLTDSFAIADYDSDEDFEESDFGGLRFGREVARMVAAEHILCYVNPSRYSDIVESEREVSHHSKEKVNLPELRLKFVAESLSLKVYR